MDPSLKPDPHRKGSYYRRIQDIKRALEKLDVQHLPPTIQFLAYYFACEKLARGIVGIHLCLAATKAYRHNTKVCLPKIRAAATALSLSIPSDDLDYLFADFNEQGVLRSVSSSCNSSARVLRNTLGHDFGPSNVANVSTHAGFLIPKMIDFLASANQVLAYQKKHFSNIP